MHGMHPLYQLGYISTLKTECFIYFKKNKEKKGKRKRQLKKKIVSLQFQSSLGMMAMKCAMAYVLFCCPKLGTLTENSLQFHCLV